MFEGLRCGECRKLYNKLHKSTPEFKAKRREQRNSPEGKLKEKRYRETPESKLKNQEKHKTVEYKLKKRTYYINIGKKQKKIKNIESYGITTDIYNLMFANQKGCCAICLVHQSEFRKDLAIDHCHETGIVRGLLCSPCNLVLGLMKDNQQTLNSAILYLKLKQEVINER